MEQAKKLLDCQFCLLNNDDYNVLKKFQESLNSF